VAPKRPSLRALSGGRADASPRTLASLSDEALLALIPTPEGDQALGRLYDRYGGIAYGLALRILRDSSLAEDAVQEAFLAIWRTAETFRAERGKPSTWILTLVHRRAVDLVRREERRRLPPVEAVTEADDSAPATEEQAVLRERRRAVQDALRQLPAEQREALELAYYGGLTQSELAEQLSVPLGTIKSRMFAGLRSLGDLLAETGLEPEPATEL
jgi:RNA polymerase sigma factor (sigma-70 family)